MSNLKNEIIALNNKIIESSHINKLSIERLALKEHIIEENIKTISNLELKLKNSLKANEEVDKKKIKYDFNEISFKANTQTILNDSLKQNASQLQILLDKANNDKENMEDIENRLKFLNEKSPEVTNGKILYKYSNQTGVYCEATQNIDRKEFVYKINKNYVIGFCMLYNFY